MTDATDLLTRVRRRGAIVAAVGLLATLALGVAGPTEALRGYLPAALFWLGLGLGSLVVLCIGHLITGAWMLVAQRILAAGAKTVLPLGLLMLPVVIGMGRVFPWAGAWEPADTSAIEHAAGYLDGPFFAVRWAVYVAVWSLGAWAITRASQQQDADGRDRTDRMRALAAAALIATTLLLLFASTDWILSLDPGWTSTVFGWLVGVGQMLAASAAATVALVALRDAPPLRAVVRTAHLHDWGTWLFSLVILWVYLSFMQFLVIWSGDLPAEITWILDRSAGAWLWVGIAIAAFQFALPFAVLLSRRTKRAPARLAAVAGVLLVVHAVETMWLVLPSFPTTGAVEWLAWAAALVGLGGVWTAAFAHALLGMGLLPTHDARVDHVLTPAPVPS